MSGIIKRMLSCIGTALLVLILIVIIQQKLSGEVPGLFGYHLMYVLTGSMSPELEAGDVVLVKRIDAEALELGDVICYYGTEGETRDKLITHKLIRTLYEENGECFLQTKGTANFMADKPIREGQVFGKVIMRFVMIGKLYKFFRTIPGLITILSPIVLMMALEIRRLIQIVREDKNGSAE